MKSKIELESMFDNAQTMHLQEFINYYTPDTTNTGTVDYTAPDYLGLAKENETLKQQLSSLQADNERLKNELESIKHNYFNKARQNR